MNKEEFERLKEEEKRHLRELRALKGQYREVERKKGILDALRGLTNPEADATHEEMVDRLSRQNAEAEARFEVARESAAPGEDALERRAREEAERAALRKAEAEALVRQMKQEMGAGAPAAPSAPGERAPAGGKTIGRVPPEEGAADAPPEARDAKTIGRSRPSE